MIQTYTILLFTCLLSPVFSFGQNWVNDAYEIQLDSTMLNSIEDVSFLVSQEYGSAQHNLTLDSTGKLNFSYITMGGESPTLILKKDTVQMRLIFADVDSKSKTRQKSLQLQSFENGYFGLKSSTFQLMEPNHRIVRFWIQSHRNVAPKELELNEAVLDH